MSAGRAGDGETWTVGALLRATQAFLHGRGIASARLDAELLLCQVLGRDRIYLYTHYDQPVTGPERDALRPLVRQRGAHAPIAYLRGEQEFYGVPLTVTPDVLIPRPETEHVVEAALAWCQARGCTAPQVVDVGCGSGAIAVALALQLPDATVWATDVSAKALAVARRNVQRHQLTARVHLVHADLLTPLGPLAPGTPPLPDAFDMVLSNPPYVVAAAALPKTVVDYEPHGALFAGADGLDVLRRLIVAAAPRLQATGLLAVEYAPEQTAALRALLRPSFAGVHVLRDLAGHERVAAAWRGAGDARDFASPFAAGVAGVAGEAQDDAPAAADAVPHVQLDDPDVARD